MTISQPPSPPPTPVYFGPQSRGFLAWNGQVLRAFPAFLLQWPKAQN